MYYRFIIMKNKQKSGLFHPKQNWNVKKENGLYDVVRKNFSDLPYTKEFAGKTTSWFKHDGLKKFENGIKELEQFYKQYDINVYCIKKEKIGKVLAEDDFQVWCEK